MMLRLTVMLLLAWLLPIRASAAGAGVQIIYEGKKSTIANANVTPQGLWITTRDLALATGFHIKPQGICRDEMCFPIPAGRKAEFITKKGQITWFNLTRFAELIKQPVAADDKNGVWYFGERVQAHEAYLESLNAPDFTLPDQNGKKHSLSDYRGKKVLLLTWASW
jgi:hypothetical protein